MLELQRASAGSGKTYALARKFIWYFITIRESDDPGSPRRLRTFAELTDSLSHILAVTFTNKATAEMQQRIVEKLYALGYPPSDKEPDYMKDFLHDLRENDPDISAGKISEVCRKAVNILLNHYSDFHVSTIDSFFQQVLRTFAYESDLNDSYRIELDSKYLSTVAIDALLEDINSGREGREATYWVAHLTEKASREEKKWNPFAKRNSGDNPYSFLISSVRRLENEEFKKKRGEIDSYFAGEPDLTGIYEELRDLYEPRVENAYNEIRRKARALRVAVDASAGQIADTDIKTFRTRVEKAFRLKLWSDPKEEDFPLPVKRSAAYDKRKEKGDTNLYERLENLAGELTDAATAWASLLADPEMRLWRVYRDNIPFLGLLQSISEKRDRYLRENNAIEIGETNAMLQEIIRDDDTPFIYERLGTRIRHFLIDEFQDTSRMQWLNMSPLLRESIAQGDENLIIGDAKQSIYRFRNADSKLISEIVPAEFGIPSEDDTPNINWRSDLRIVQFNNGFFSFLAKALNDRTGKGADASRRDFVHDYSNVVQYPRHQKPRGYVEVHLDMSGRGRSTNVLEQLPPLIESIIDRGFSAGDIAVLVDKHTQGDKVIEMLTLHNARPERRHYIDFVSEQSLKLETSAAVSLIVSVLQTICNGADPQIRTGEEARAKGVADWSQISCNFRFFALRNPELSTTECLERFFETGGDNRAISDMLRKMQAVSLPALVEAISAELVLKEVRQREAVFISAFQDIVLDYCNGHSSDIASFLKWWDEHKAEASITSPEGLKAVRVMTIHKSKGLEFPVVIVPFADVNFSDSSSKTEWRWVRPGSLTAEKGKLPPYIPVVTDKNLIGTPHEGLYYEFHDMKKMDALNSLYVAFTRAVNELYIFSEPKSGPLYLSSLLKEYLNAEEHKEGIEKFDRKELKEPEDGVYVYGHPYSTYPSVKEDDNPKVAEKKEDESENDVEAIDIEDYTGRPTPDFLAYKIDTESSSGDDKADEEEPGPRSEGKLLHHIMEQVNVREDIPRAVRRVVMQGDITREKGKELTEFLKQRISLPEVEGWFDGSYRVITERPLLRRGYAMTRPDRVMVDKEGNAVVVDYKFGESRAKDTSYMRQVKEYVGNLKDTGLFMSVKGYLWYVRLGAPEFVTD